MVEAMKLIADLIGFASHLDGCQGYVNDVDCDCTFTELKERAARLAAGMGRVSERERITFNGASGLLVVVNDEGIGAAVFLEDRPRPEVIALRDALTEWIGDMIEMPRMPENVSERVGLFSKSFDPDDTGKDQR